MYTSERRVVNAGLTSEKAAKAVESKFDLVLIAVRRARELTRGDAALVKGKNKPIVTALREIEEGKIGRDYLKKIG